MWLIVGQIIVLCIVVGIVVLFALDDRKNRKEREEEDRLEKLEQEKALAREKVESQDKQHK